MCPVQTQLVSNARLAGAECRQSSNYHFYEKIKARIVQEKLFARTLSSIKEFRYDLLLANYTTHQGQGWRMPEPIPTVLKLGYLYTFTTAPLTMYLHTQHIKILNTDKEKLTRRDTLHPCLIRHYEHLVFLVKIYRRPQVLSQMR